MCSTLNASVTSVCGAYLFLALIRSPGEYTYGNTPRDASALRVATFACDAFLGYIAYDVHHVLVEYPMLGGGGIVLHHLGFMACTAFFRSTLTRGWLLAMEVSTIFFNMHWFARHVRLQHDGAIVERRLGIAFAVVFFLSRAVEFAAGVTHVASSWRGASLPDLHRRVLYTGLVCSWLLNVWWFTDIIRALKKKDLTPAVRDDPPLIAFTGGGVYFFWQAGLATTLQLMGLTRGARFAGASAGAITACFLACDVDFEVAVARAVELAHASGLYERPLGSAGVWGKIVHRWLDDLLPEDCAPMCTGRLEIVLLRIWPWVRHERVSEYGSKADVIAAVMASSHVPWFMNLAFCATTPRGTYIDAALWGARTVVGDPRGGKTVIIDHNYDPATSRSLFWDWARVPDAPRIRKMMDAGASFVASNTDCFKVLSKHSL